MTKTLRTKTLVAAVLLTSLVTGTAVAQSLQFARIDRVLPFDTDSWRVSIPRGAVTIVVDAGTHTDVDCRAYDALTGELLAEDDDLTSYCILNVFHRRSGPIEIQIENTGGVGNTYDLSIRF